MQQSGPTGKTALDRLIQDHVPLESSSAVLVAYEAILSALWGQLVPLVGQQGAQAVFARAIQIARRRQPLAGQIRAMETGLDFGALHTEDLLGNPQVLAGATTALTESVGEVVDGLIGTGLLVSLLGEVDVALRRGASSPIAPYASGDNPAAKR